MSEKLTGQIHPPLFSESEHDFVTTAKWISTNAEYHDNYYFLARKSFDYSKFNEKETLRITADTRYSAYLNGKFVGNGPIRGTHKRCFVDSYNISQLLEKGENWLAIEVHCPVRATFSSIAANPGLLASIPGIIDTDSTWEIIEDPSHHIDAEIYTRQIGFSEWKEIHPYLEQWQIGRDSMKEWSKAKELDFYEHTQGRKLTLRPIAHLTNNLILPTAIVDVGYCGFENSDHAGLYADTIASEAHHKDFSRIENFESLTSKEGPSVLYPNDEGNTYVILDFGQEVFGNLTFDIETCESLIMDVTHDEKLESGRLLGKYHDYRFADRFILREGRQCINQRLHLRGFRYLQVNLRNFHKPVKLHMIGIYNRIYSEQISAKFESTDTELNKLWGMCCETIRVCSSDTFMDCPWREQAFWLPDQSVTNLYYILATGDAKYPAHNFQIASDGMLDDGSLPSVYPSDRSICFPSQNALWTIALWDYFLYTGNVAFVKKMIGYLEKALIFYEKLLENDNLVAEDPDKWNFIDWGYKDEFKGKTAILNLLIAAAYKRAASLEEAIGKATQADRYIHLSSSISNAVARSLWNEQKGSYDDCTEPDSHASQSQHPLAIAIYFDLLDEQKKSKAIDALADGQHLTKAELYFQHYVISALSENGKHEKARKIIKDMWGKMLAENSPTIWENRDGRTEEKACWSSCHAFACGPMYFLQGYLLGVRPIKAGFSEFIFQPEMLDFEKLSGTIPTPHGMITIDLNKNDGLAYIRVPAMTSARLRDGQLLAPGQHRLSISDVCM